MHSKIEEPQSESADESALPAQIAVVTHRRFTILLISLVVLLVLSPLTSGRAEAFVLLNVLFSVVMLSAVVTASDRKLTLLIALALAVPWVYVSWLHPVWRPDALHVLSDSLLGVMTLFVLLIVLSSVLRAPSVTIDGLCGAVSVYLLIGIFFAVCFRIVETVAPGSFSIPEQAPTDAWVEGLYFSLVTLSTLGYGDITPVSPVARVWAALEAITGTLYLTLLIARLVGQYSSD